MELPKPLNEMEFEELYNLFFDTITEKIKNLEIEEETEEIIQDHKQIFELVQEGINIKYHIEYLINEINIIFKLEKEEVYLGRSRKKISLKDFFKERRERSFLMRKWLQENIEKRGKTKSN